MLYSLLLYIHVASVIISVGPFFLLLSLVRKMKTTVGDVTQAYLDTFRFSVRLAKHAGHVLVASGVGLILAGHWTWTTPWILMTIIILVCSLLFLARAFTPTIRQFGEQNVDRDVLVHKLKRAIWIYLTLLMIMLWFMVTKPVLWQ
ncbi:MULTISPECIES: hypothetical protein [unclassified Bacillus (in: firmicutes)]|uniref:hypothetical protein n=1 Tax=unclassified Bacillus (in: firmicutes) TaxID=185979 RepID=UPI000B80F594|nr:MULTISPECIES: hypothetical protein [unclassified Bacillus (in: firmicutes)]